MICKNYISNNMFNYEFVENGMVKLTSKGQSFEVKYEDWVNDYLIIDKWNSLKTE